MKKKELSKGIVFSLFFALILVIISSSFVLSQAENEYAFGDKVKIELPSSGSYIMKLTTPSETFNQKGSAKNIVFRPNELGDYYLELRQGDYFYEESFTVYDPDASILDILKFNKEEKEFNGIDFSEQEQVVVGKDVKWVENFNGKSAKILRYENITIRDSLGNTVEDFEVSDSENGSEIVFSTEGDYDVEYYTKGPEKKEKNISKDKKEVEISSELHYLDVLAFTDVDEEVEVGNKGLYRIYWRNESRYLSFKALDTNENGLIDRLEWIVPHLSTQTFEIIKITKAEHLDSSFGFIEDVFNEVKEQDNVWFDFPDGDYVKVTFEKNLTNEKDITVYAKANSSASIEVYPEYAPSEVIAVISGIAEEGFYKVILENLVGIEDTFYLRAVGDMLIDLIIDPTTGGTASGGLRPQTVTCWATNGAGTASVVEACVGTYTSSCPSLGGSDQLSCDDGNEEIHESKKSQYAQVIAEYFDTGVTDCVQVDYVGVCYEWSNGAQFTSCSLDYDSGGDDTWSNIVNTCPGAGSSGCSDVTASASETWSCGSFFGASGTRATARATGTSSSNPPQQFNVDQLWYNVSYSAAGSVNIVLNTPSTVSVNTETIDTNFTVNATITCVGVAGDICGDVEAMIRYNATTASPDTQIPGSGTPLYTTGNMTCSKLNQTTGENTCDVVWEVNATQTGNWEIDVYAESEFSLVGNNNTADAEIATRQGANLDLNLTAPLVDPEISEGESFDLNCTAYCNDQDCTNVVVYPIFCTGSGCSPDTFITTGSIGLTSDVNSVSLGGILTGANEVASFSITGDYGDYVLSCNATSDNAGSPTSQVETQIHVNDFPVAAFTYPTASEWLHGTETLDASASTDAENNITNYLFEIDDNSGFTSSSTICNGASATCNLDTISQTQCSQETATCFVRVTTTDNYTKTNSTFLQVGIDNVGPATTIGQPANDSYIDLESYLINASATDSGSGVACVEFEFFNGTWNALGVDCSAAYEHNWDLSSIPDQILEVRARANDSETNFGIYDINGNITHDTTKPIVVSDAPVDLEIITADYLLNATSSSDNLAGVKNVSWYYFNSGWNLIGSDTDATGGWTFNWVIGIADGTYDLKVEVYDNAGNMNETNVSDVVLDTGSDAPICTVIYPNGAEEVNGQIVFNATATDADPSDVVENVSFEYSKNNGATWTLIGTNTSSDQAYYLFDFDTTLDTDGIEYLIRCNATDTRGSVGSDESNNNFTVDNTAPSITGGEVNESFVEVNSYVCLNLTVTDNIVGVNTVLAEIDYPLSIINVTLLDDGLGCDVSAGDDVYSAEYQLEYDGAYNWTNSYATDDLGNQKIEVLGLNWSAFSNSYLISELLSPLVDFEINESGFNNEFQVSCNITCNVSGSDCDAVNVDIEYFDGSWLDMDNEPADPLYNYPGVYSCGNLLSGESCSATLNLTAGNNSGNGAYDLRCHGSSSNAAADYSSTVNVQINDFPTAAFTYPSEGEFLHGTETLDAGASFDLDGSLANYKFEVDTANTFLTPVTLYNGPLSTYSWNTILQTECTEEDNNCYLRLTVTDDDSTSNSTFIQVVVDNAGPTTTLDLPENDTLILTESQIVNATATDFGTVDCVVFEGYYDGGWNSLATDCSSPYQFTWDLSSVGDQSDIEIRARANDTESNFGVYDINGNLTHDINGPVVTLNAPAPDVLIGNNVVDFNFTSTDLVSGVHSCSIYLDGSENNTNSSVVNGTLTNFNIAGISDGLHNWYVNCSDEYNHVNVSETRNFTVDTLAPEVYLNLPLDGSWSASTEVEFNFTPEDPHLDYCEFWINSSGWSLNETFASPNNFSENLFSKNLSDGNYIWNVYCEDTLGNGAFNSTNYTISVDTVFPDISYNNNTDENNSFKGENWIFVNVTAIDGNKDSVVLEWQGVNETFDNVLGDVYWENKTALSEGVYTFRAYINDSAGNTNLTLERTVTIDLSAPNYTSQNQTVGEVYSDIFHRGEVINLSVNWFDTVELDTAWLETNETGSFETKTSYNSPQNLAGNDSVAWFNWTNDSVALGESVSWRIYANDTAGNENFTSLNSFQVWGWSEVSNSYLFPAGIPEGGETTQYCFIVDNVTEQAISGYNVSFYNGTDFLGSNITDATGLATWTFSMAEAGSYSIMCNITDDATKYYNASAQNEGIDTLGVGYQLTIYDYTDTTYNKAYEGIINTTTTQIGDTESYSSLLNDDNDYQERRTDTSTETGQYAYTRFEFNITENLVEVIKINMSWRGYGSIGSGTPGYILYWYNWTLGGWQQMVSQSGSAAEAYENITFEEIDFTDFIDTDGKFHVLSRSFSTSPTSGSLLNRWVEIATDQIFIEVYTDILPPIVELKASENYYNSSSQTIDFECSVVDDSSIDNVTLYGDWNGGWHLNETNTSQLNNANYTFQKNISDGTYVWNCEACDKAGNCEMQITNWTFTVDTIAPNMTLFYPGDGANFSSHTILKFNYSVSDIHEIANCSLYGSWNGWGINQTNDTVTREIVNNFSSITVPTGDYYNWSVGCYDSFGNFNISYNHTFAAFLPPADPDFYNISQTANDGTGDITLVWNSTNETAKYRIYSSPNATDFSYLTETTDTNYTDTAFSGNKRKFYKVESWNPTSSNLSDQTFGSHVYEFFHNNVGSRNWFGFPTNFSYIVTANDSLYEINNATSVTMYNETSQIRTTCNTFSCPSTLVCTPTNCDFNFDFEAGKGYEVNIDTGGATAVNWSGVGIVLAPQNITLVYDESGTLFNKQWIAMTATSTLADGQALGTSITGEDAVNRWDAVNQNAEGLIESPFPWVPGLIGTNFNLEMEGGYEVSMTQDSSWVQQ